jgi:hypothetical protein
MFTLRISLRIHQHGWGLLSSINTVSPVVSVQAAQSPCVLVVGERTRTSVIPDRSGTALLLSYTNITIMISQVQVCQQAIAHYLLNFVLFCNEPRSMLAVSLLLTIWRLGQCRDGNSCTKLRLDCHPLLSLGLCRCPS